MKVNIQGLKRGVNPFEFDADLDVLSFDAVNYDVNLVHVSSSVDKSDESIIVNSEFTADLRPGCDRCLKQFDQTFEDRFTIIYTTTADSLGDDDSVRLLSQSTQTIDLSEGLREAVLLALPMQFKCSKDCKGLCDQCGANLNVKTCSCTKEFVDARWAGLQKLLGGTDGE